MQHWRVIAATLFLAALGCASRTLAAPDADKLGKRQGYPVAGLGAGIKHNWYFDEFVRVGSFTHQAEIPGLFSGPVHELKPAARPLELGRARTAPDYRWNIGKERNLSVDDFLARQRVMGLLIIKDGTIQVERYQYDRKPSDRFTSNSMSKSIASLGIGIALGEGRIASLDDRADKYAPKLAGTVFGETTIRNLLRMAVGARYKQGYNPGEGDTVAFWPVVEREGIERAASFVKRRERPQGQRFDYISPATLMLAAVLRGATGMSLSEYLTPRLWQSIGAQDTALWRADRSGLEVANGNFNATLRDYARLAVVLANDGVRPDDASGKAIVPREYLLDATDARRVAAPFRPGKATPSLGYGYQFWLYPGKRRLFSMLGTFGQSIFVDPDHQLVIVMTGANATAQADDTTLGRERAAFWRGVMRRYESASSAR